MAVYAALDVRTLYVSSVSVVGVEKRNVGYVYSMTVSWSNRESYQIYRPYSDILAFKQKLEHLFSQHSSKIPQLPAFDSIRKVFGLLNESAHQSRQELVDKLCKAVVNLPPEVSHARIVGDFFTSRPGDLRIDKIGNEGIRVGRPSLHPMIEPKGHELKEYKVKNVFKALDEKQLDLKEGETVVMLQEDPSGWVCVGKPDFDTKKGKIGWVPKDFLEDSSVLNESCIDHSVDYAVFLPQNMDEELASLSEQYLAIASYTVEEDDGSRLPFSSGDKLSVYDKAEDGWWLAEVNGRSGWVPSTYLIRLEAGPEDQDTCLVTPEVYITTEEHKAGYDDEISIPEGAKVNVIMKQLSGWWQVRYNGCSGLIPAGKLQPRSPKLPNKYTSILMRKTFKTPPRRGTVVSTKEVGLLRETLKGPSQSSHSSIQPDSKPTEGNMTNSDDNGELSGSYDKPHMWIKSSHGSSRDIIYALLKKSGKVPVLPNAPPPLQPSSRLGSQTLDTECPKEASQTSGSSSLSGRVFRPQERATAGIRHSVVHDDDKVPRYTKHELMTVIDERNELKLKLYSVFEELEVFKELVRNSHQT